MYQLLKKLKYMMQYRRCNLCLQMKERPHYESNDQLVSMCRDCAYERNFIGRHGRF